MIQFIWPWMFALLPLPWLVRRFSAPVPDAQQAALRVPFLQDFADMEYAGGASGRRSRRLFWLALLAWLLLVTAAARPQWLGAPVNLPVSGRDLMLAIDLSGSMQLDDFVLDNQAVDRLTAVKAVASQFIERRKGDRVGLILFGDRAYLQAPLTFDRATIKRLLFESFLGLAGKQTAIGDAIGLAVKHFRDKPETQQVLILMSDGANTAGELAPLKAADLAAKAGLKIYTIGIGANAMERRTLFGMRYSVDPSSDLDEHTLRAIADKTGGRYFRAHDTQELGQIYQMLDQLEPVEVEDRSFRPRRALFYWPLSLAFALSLIGLVVYGVRR